jgi:DNA-binding CsgD family transcriptional regulator
VFVARGDEIRAKLREGWSIRQVADQLGLSTNTVAYHRDRTPHEKAKTPDLRYTVGRVRTREAVAALLAEGLSQAESARRLGINKSTVSYHAGRLGKPRDERGARRYDWVVIQAYYDCGFTKRECEEAFGFSSHAWHNAVKRGDIVARPQRIPDDELFVSGVARSRNHLKARILEADLKPSSCSTCGISSWQGRPLSLALHHVNGDRHDHRLENLELLCPNCHSQTESFAGRNRQPATA